MNMLKLSQNRKIAALIDFIHVHLFYEVITLNINVKWMKLALLQAYKALLKNEVPVGAVIVRNGKIISRAYNMKETKNVVTKHAELIAIEKASRKIANWRLVDCDIYITLKPCPMCASAIKQARIRHVYYGTSSYNNEESNIVDKIFTNKDSNCIVNMTGGILEEDCNNIITEFFKSRRD